MRPAEQDPAHVLSPFGDAGALDVRETTFRVASHHRGQSLFLRHLPPTSAIDQAQAPIVLYVHGATFPSALSVAHRFDGRSWRDELCAAGFHVWGLDFLGFGGADRYTAMGAAADADRSLGRAEDASRQIETAVRFILARQRQSRLSLIAHSWGTIAAGRFAGHCPDLVERLVWFGPIARREIALASAMPQLPAWRLITLQDQWNRFVEDVPAGAAAVLQRAAFETWGRNYLASDPQSGERAPAAVKVPSGPQQDIIAAWHGELAYDPKAITAPIAILRGEWDSLTRDADAKWLFDALTATPEKLDIKLGCGTHLMHLEDGRHRLHSAARDFLSGQTAA